MNIQIFGTSKCFDTKKAQRYFKERGIKFQMIDLKEKEMSRGEFENVARALGGWEQLVNPAAKDKQTLALLRQAGERGDLHFIGNIEAKEAIKGGCDVIVTDGFSGNIMLKSIEGVGSFAGSALKGMFKKNLLTKLAALLVMPGLNAFKARLDPNKVGGTAFIGISRPVIKAHGASNAEAIENAVGQAVQVAQSGIVEAITANIDKMQMLSE